MRRLAIGLIATAVIIVLTLAWDMTDHSHWGKVQWWPFGPGRVRPIDLVANALLYVPLGIAVPGCTLRRRLCVAAIVGATLSGLLELTQVWSHQRIPSVADVIMNVAGAMMGAAMARHRAFDRAFHRLS